MPNRTHLPGLSALPEYKACLSVWCPYSVDPEAELRLIVQGQFTCREGGNKSKRVLLVGMLPSPHTLKCTAESPRNIFVYSYIFSCVCAFFFFFLQCNVSWTSDLFCCAFSFVCTYLYGFSKSKYVRKSNSKGITWSRHRARFMITIVAAHNVCSCIMIFVCTVFVLTLAQSSD